MLITKSEAARRLGVTKQALQQWENRDPRPGYFVDTDSKVMVDTSSEDWIQRIKQSETKGIKQNLINEKVSQAKKFKADLKKSVFDNVDDVENESEDLSISQIKQIEGGRFFKGALRQAILKRDGYRCVLCGKSPADGVRLEIDHIIEFEDGGKTTYDNGQTLCGDCNKGKSSFKKMATDEYISQTEFGRRVGAHRNTIADAIDKGIIDKDVTTGNINFTTEVIKWYAQNSVSHNGKSVDGEYAELEKRAAIAAMEDIIFAAGIKREKEMQEKLKTLEIKKDLANVDLMIHFFSFIENIIQRWYRRPHEIGPKLKAFYLGGQDREAEQLMLRELESIVKDTQKDLLKALEEEGIKFKGMIKK